MVGIDIHAKELSGGGSGYGLVHVQGGLCTGS